MWTLPGPTARRVVRNDDGGNDDTRNDDLRKNARANEAAMDSAQGDGGRRCSAGGQWCGLRCGSIFKAVAGGSYARGEAWGVHRLHSVPWGSEGDEVGDDLGAGRSGRSADHQDRDGRYAGKAGRRGGGVRKDKNRAGSGATQVDDEV